MATFESAVNYALTGIGTFVQRLVPDYIIPNISLIIYVFLLLIAGYIAGKVCKLIVTKILAAVGLKRLTTRTWAESVIRITGYKGTIVELIGDIVKWILYITFLGIIIQAIGFPGVADIFTQTAVFLPRLIAAILIVVIGFIIADFFGKVFEEAGSRLLDEGILASLSGGIARYSIAIVVIIMALSLIGIDPAALTIMFAVVLAAFVVSILIGTRDILPTFSAGIAIKGSIKIGDKIKIGQYTGVVEKLGPTSMTLKNGKKHILIPNSMLIKEPIEKLN
jgi:small-conductance mechanosensitive channel